MEPEPAYKVEDLVRARKELQKKDARENIADFAKELKQHLEKLSERLSQQALNFHKEPTEEEGMLKDIRHELHGIYDDLNNAKKMLDVAPTLLNSRYELQMLGIVNEQLRSFLDCEYSDADMRLSGACRIASQCRSLQSQEIIQPEISLALARSAREAANSYRRFADAFEALATVIGDLADRVKQASGANPGGSTR